MTSGMDAFESFITENAQADTSRLILSRKDWPSPSDPGLASIPGRELAVGTIEARKKLRRKVPQWYSCTSLVFPSALSAEQCSSSDTAFYKAALVRETVGTGARVADLTGGLGVDSWAFSKDASMVLYNDSSAWLAASAVHNFKALGVYNVVVSNEEISPDTLEAVAGPFRPDLIYLDPGRRDSSGRKVFLLEDCSPDVSGLLPALFRMTRYVLLKLSPMIDLSLAVSRLDAAAEVPSMGEDGPWNVSRVREIHVVASGGECKEVLVLLDREWEGEYKVVCREDSRTVVFSSGEISRARPTLVGSTYAKVLFEPGKSLSKAGAFNVLCERFSLSKLARSTHLYTLPEALTESETEQACGRLQGLGKVFRVLEVLPLDRRGLKEVSRRWPVCEVSARNISLSSDELRSRLKVSPGGEVHVFGVRIEMPHGAGNYLIVCTKA